MEQLLLHFVVNALTVGLITGTLYYPRSKRRDYTFTFLMISISVFMMIFMLGDVDINIGFTLGLFAIFGIIRYRTEQMPVREMTYLFIIIAVSVINALFQSFSWLEICVADLLFYVSIFVCEYNTWLKHVSTKSIKYDRIELIVPSRRSELIEDLQKRTGLKILRIEIGDIDFLRDMAVIKVSYESDDHSVNTADNEEFRNS